MSEEETKVEAATEEVPVDEVQAEEEASAEAEEAQVDEAQAEAAAEDADEIAIPKKKKKKWPIVVGVIVVVLIAAGAGFWVWHEQPSFCNAICHVPMDPYNATYDAQAGEPGVDKWGNDVTNSSAMMVVVHKDAGEDCLACHVPSIGEQISEGMNWVTGNYLNPLEERDLDELTEARGIEGEEFCLNSTCHDITRDDLIEATADLKRNPHVPQHGEVDCNQCHKAHRASINYCSQCHSDAPIPDGWLTSAQASKLPNKA
ncbi:MAG: cytochrome c3 family protein [Coriobacteriaceae bacterium]|nr:cytochrome c3 family protein [Coriobacteriaceae bacterium]